MHALLDERSGVQPALQGLTVLGSTLFKTVSSEAQENGIRQPDGSSSLFQREQEK